MKDPEHITPRWCFNCEAWRDVEPWNIMDNGCRCRTCGWVISVNFKQLECTVCKRVCEGWPDYDGCLSCSHACAYKIGHVTRATMIERGKLKEKP